MDQSKTCTFYCRQGGQRSSQCKDCIKARMRAVREPHLVQAPKLPRDERGKVCPKCRDYKLYELFIRPRSREIGTYCRACQLAVDKAAKERNRERNNRLSRERWALPVDLTEIRHCCRCDQNKPRTEFPANGKGGYCKPCRAAYARERNARRRDHVREQRYGYTPAMFAELLARQGGGCAICGRTEVTNGRWKSADARDLHVDHDHVAGVVRGLLCNQCNPALGMLNDNPDLFLRAAEYLKNPPAIT